MSIELFKEVSLRRDLPVEGLRAGDVGTVVEILPHPASGPRGIMLEVFNAVGDTVAIVTVPETDVDALTANEVFAVRPLSRVG